MADISRYLTEILNAVFGEEVRSSIYNSIDIINKVGEKVLTLGTAVTSSGSSISGYYKDSLYLNTNTWDLWKCSGTAWVKQGNFQGAGITSILKKSTAGLVDTYEVRLTNNTVAGTFKVTNGNKTRVGNAVTSPNTSTIIDNVSYGENDIYINNQTWDVWLCNGTGWTNVGNIKGEQGIQGSQGYSITNVTPAGSSGLTKTYNIYNSNNELVGTFSVTDGRDGTDGERGPQGIQGTKGDPGYSPTVSVVKTGKVATITITDATGPHVFTITDGNDGTGTGDMVKSTYDTNNDGVVDLADNVANMDSAPTQGSGKPVTSGGLRQIIGNPADLQTTSTDLVGAINEAATKGGLNQNNVTETGSYANAAGTYTRATESNQFVVGQYNDNVSDDYHVNALFEVGNGTTPVKRSNAFQVLKNGDVRVAGDLYVQDQKVSARSIVHVGDFVITSSNWGTVNNGISRVKSNIDTGLDIIYANYGCDNQTDFLSKYTLLAIPKTNNPMLDVAVLQPWLSSNDTSVMIGGFAFVSNTSTTVNDVTAQIFAVPYSTIS